VRLSIILPKKVFHIFLLLLSASAFGQGQRYSYADLSTDSLISLTFELSGSNLDSSLSSAKALASRFESNGDTLAGVYGYNLLGFSYYYKDLYLDGINAYRRSNEIISQNSNYDFLKVENHVGLGSLYSLMGNYSSAVDQLLKAQDCINEEYQAYDKALLYQTMAELFFDIGEYNTALKYAGKVNAALVDEYGPEEAERLSTVTTLIAEVMAIQGHLDSAETLANQSLQYAQESHETLGIIYSHEALAAVNFKRGQMDSAIARQTKAYQLAKSFKDKFTLALEAADLGAYYLANNDLAQAEKFKTEAMAITRNFPPNLARKEALNLAYKVAEAKDEYARALSLYKDLSLINQQMAGADISEELIKSRYLVSEKERKLLTLKSELQQEHIASQKKFNILISTITLLLAMAIIVALLAIRNSRKFNRKLSHKQKILNDQRQELRNLNEELEANGKNKDKLLSILSHDVRQPFNQTISLLEILEHSEMPEPGMDEMVKSIKQSVRDHKHSIDNLLTWSKSQLNGFSRKPIDVDIEKITDEVTLALSSSLKEKHLSVIKKISAGTSAFVDPDQLEIILKNLVGNAIKFSHPDQQIEVRAYSEGNTTFLEVADQGVGMDKESQQKLLDTKQQFSSRGTLDETGSGFGTLIILDFVAQNNGKLELASELGKGTTFKVSFPASQESPNKKRPSRLEEAPV